jgi:octaheme c-type cytochrome (tetrathionate reductase family)
MNFKKFRFLILPAIAVSLPFAFSCDKGGAGSKAEVVKPQFVRKARTHLDHAAFFKKKFERPEQVTAECLKCHQGAAAEVMKTSHWQWLGSEVTVPGHDKPMRIGKKNLVNNFCIGIQGNWASCTKCHAGYGWSDDKFDFTKADRVDCLVCHEWSGTYVKDESGIPKQGTDLASVAGSVGYPKRENCAVCHNYGGGGQGVKHGDLDSSLENPSSSDDIHMGGLGFLCIDCHKTKNHNIPGKAFSVSVENSNGVACTDCHKAPPHRDARINSHLSALACQTCHIPTYARKLPTKTYWDWSKAGDPSKSDDPHKYLKIKGEFVYDTNIVPEYAWFNMTMDRYILGDRIDPSKVVDINKPLGDIRDKAARIWPFKVHRAQQHYDKKFSYLLAPLTGGKGGYWKEFDWDKALRLGAENTGLKFSGEFGWVKTEMYWPLSHMVTPKGSALTCRDCHGEKGRLDWKALGFEGDPERFGGRK